MDFFLAILAGLGALVTIIMVVADTDAESKRKGRNLLMAGYTIGALWFLIVHVVLGVA